MSSASGSLSEEENVAGDPTAPIGTQPPPSNVEYPEPGSWVLDSTFKFLWDGWNLAMEIDGDDNPIRSYGWGLDLSGSEQGAGGVGGLCFETEYAPQPISHPGLPVVNGEYHATYDYNGNLTSLRTPTGGTVARYEYGPFGESLTNRDVLAGTNPFRFSTKYTDPETGLLYYGYRYYNAGLGRWMSRDFIEERDGPATVAMLANGVIDSVDSFGLWKWKYGSRGGQPRALVIPDPEGYDDQYSISSSFLHFEFDGDHPEQWLFNETLQRYVTPTEKINSCHEFSIPNTVYVTTGVLGKVSKTGNKTRTSLGLPFSEWIVLLRARNYSQTRSR